MWKFSISLSLQKEPAENRRCCEILARPFNEFCNCSSQEESRPLLLSFHYRDSLTKGEDIWERIAIQTYKTPRVGKRIDRIVGEKLNNNSRIQRKNWDSIYRLTFINSSRRNISRFIISLCVKPSLWTASRITFYAAKCQNALADGDLIISEWMDGRYPPLSKNRLPDEIEPSRLEGIQGRVPVASILSCISRERRWREWRNRSGGVKNCWGDRVGGWEEDVDLERAAEEARSRWKVGRGNQDVRFPQIPYPPKVKQEVAAFPPFLSIFPAGLRAAGLIDTFNDSGKNGG